MDIRLFYVTEDRSIGINKYCIVVRHYYSLKKDSYTDVDYYLNEEAAYELENNVIPKHQLLEKISKTIIDVSNYAWAEGIKLRTSDENKEILEIVNYGSIEAYKASLPEATDDFKIDTDYRL